MDIHSHVGATEMNVLKKRVEVMECLELHSTKNGRQ